MASPGVEKGFLWFLEMRMRVEEGFSCELSFGTAFLVQLVGLGMLQSNSQ